MWQGRDAGWTWRIPKERNSLTNSAWRAIERRKYCGNWNPGLPRALVTCQNFRDAEAPDIFIWGDSHGLHLIAGISEAYPDANVYALYLNGCVFQSGFEGYIRRLSDKALESDCVERNEAALAFFEEHPAATVILSSAKRATPEAVAPAVNHVRDALEAAGHDVLLLGDVVIPGIDLNHCRTVPDYLISKRALKRRCAPDPAAIARQFDYNREMVALVGGYVDPAPIQCPDGTCQFYLRKQSLFRDNHHLTVDGSIALMRKVLGAIGRLEP